MREGPGDVGTFVPGIVGSSFGECVLGYSLMVLETL
jgi:hypothetical protein